jgi:hypothetical protein
MCTAHVSNKAAERILLLYPAVGKSMAEWKEMLPKSRTKLELIQTKAQGTSFPII